MDVSDDALYAQAAKELADGATDLGIAAKAFAVAEGDRSRTEALYIKYRVAKLREAYRPTPIKRVEMLREPSRPTPMNRFVVALMIVFAVFVIVVFSLKAYRDFVQ